MNIYLDDLRDCPEGFTIARTMDDAIKLLEENDVEILSLDHDLGESKDGELLPDGYDFVKYFCVNGLSVGKIYMHTDNGVGRANMYETLLAAQRRGFISKEIEIYHYSITPNRYSGD